MSRTDKGCEVVQDEDRFKNIEENIKNLTTQVATLDTLVTKLVVSLDAHTTSERDMEGTIKNIDRNITDIMIKMAAAPGERQRETQEAIRPLWEHIRKNDRKLKECEEHVHNKLDRYSDKVKHDLRSEAKFHVWVIWIALAALGGVASYAYISDLSHITSSVKRNAKNIEQAHPIYKGVK